MMKVISLYKAWSVVSVVCFLYSATDICWQTVDDRGGNIPLCANEMFLLKFSLRWVGVVNMCCWLHTMSETSLWAESYHKKWSQYSCQRGFTCIYHQMEPMHNILALNGLLFLSCLLWCMTGGHKVESMGWWEGERGVGLPLYFPPSHSPAAHLRRRLGTSQLSVYCRNPTMKTPLQGTEFFAPIIVQNMEQDPKRTQGNSHIKNDRDACQKLWINP